MQGGSFPDTARYITQQHVSLRQHPSAFVQGKLPLQRDSLADTAVFRSANPSGFLFPSLNGALICLLEINSALKTELRASVKAQFAPHCAAT